MIETKDGPLYPVWRIVASNYEDEKNTILAESEMIGNIINQVAKGLEANYDTILIRKVKGEYVDARVPGN